MAESDGLLRDYKLKRGRAMHHFDVLRESVERFTNIDREPVAGQFQPDASQYVFEMPLERVDPDWTLGLGEFAYDTRASLDYLITALIRRTGQQEHNRSEFPIYNVSARVRWQDVKQWWEDGCGGKLKGQLDGTPTGTKAALKKLQPFDGVPTATDPFRHPLWALHILNNRDKHRRLNLLAHGVWTRFVDAGGQPVFEGRTPHGRVSESRERDTYTVTLAVHDERDVGVYLLPTYDVRLDEGPELFGNLIDTLGCINQYIDARVLPTVEWLLR